jgi:membrane-bound ClpP family serine protease
MTELPTSSAVNYLVLARGTTLGAARVLAVSADQQLINKFVAELTGEAQQLDERSEPAEREPLRVVRGDEE